MVYIKQLYVQHTTWRENLSECAITHLRTLLIRYAAEAILTEIINGKRNQ